MSPQKLHCTPEGLRLVQSATIGASSLYSGFGLRGFGSKAFKSHPESMEMFRSGIHNPVQLFKSEG